jgi:uracil phosphoribosyltransferase
LVTANQVEAPLAQYYAGVVRDRESSAAQIEEALRFLGHEIGRCLTAMLQLEPAVVTTPLNEVVRTLRLRNDLTAIVTTRADLDVFGKQIAATLSPTILGYMDFEGRRGFDAPDTPVREIQLPDPGSRPVSALVIAKSILATGCTAISLTRTAVAHYKPTRLVVASLFYSHSGLSELAAEFPNAEFLVVGEADELDDSGILHPGVGLIEERIARKIGPELGQSG